VDVLAERVVSHAQCDVATRGSDQPVASAEHTKPVEHRSRSFVVVDEPQNPQALGKRDIRHHATVATGTIDDYAVAPRVHEGAPADRALPQTGRFRVPGCEARALPPDFGRAPSELRHRGMSIGVDPATSE